MVGWVSRLSSSPNNGTVSRSALRNSASSSLMLAPQALKIDKAEAFAASDNLIDYLVLIASAVLALTIGCSAGLDGIAHHIEPPPMLDGNAYSAADSEHVLPTLGDAAQRFSDSRARRSPCSIPAFLSSK